VLGLVISFSDQLLWHWCINDAGAQNWAIIASIIETCKLNKIEPQGYLSSILTSITTGHKLVDIKELLPWKYEKYAG
jgi:transposase